MIHVIAPGFDISASIRTALSNNGVLVLTNIGGRCYHFDPYDIEPLRVEVAQSSASIARYKTPDGVLLARGKYYKREGDSEIKSGIPL